MDDIFLINAYVAISILSVIVGLVTAVHCIKEHKKYSHVLALASASGAFVQVFYLGSVLSSSYRMVSIMSSLFFVSIAFSVCVLLTFIRAYIVKERTRMNKIIKHGFSTLLLLDAALFTVNIFNEVMVSYVDTGNFIARYKYEYKFPYWLHLAFVYILVMVVLYHLIRRATTVPREYRRQYLLAVFGLILVVAINGLVLFVPNLFGRYALDYSIWGYSIIALSLHLNFFRYPYKGMRTYYNDWIVENVNQGVVLFNFEGDLIIHNEKVHSIFPDKKIDYNMPVDEFTKQLNLDIRDEKSTEDFSFQHYVEKNGREYPVRFDHRCLKNEDGAIIGRLFVFTDEAGDVDLLTSFYTWEKFKTVIVEEPENFNPPITVAVCDINGLGDINNHFGRNVGDLAIKTLGNIVRKHFSGESYYVRGQEAALIVLCFDMDENTARERMEAVYSDLLGVNNLGCIIDIQSAIEVVKDGGEDVLTVVKQALMSMKNKKLLDVRSRKSELVTSLVKTLSESDTDTEPHVKRTQILGEELGKRLGLSDMQRSDLQLLCILHDIGKIGIPTEIVNKPGKLSDAEWRMMRTHTEKGYQIATSSQELEHIADMILHHHESWDGHGYPDGLSKESIPLLSRIISVVDAYDAMVNDRVYRPAMSVEAAMNELRRCAGTQFDPSIVNEFLNMLPEINHIDEDANLDLLASAKDKANDETVRPTPAHTNSTNVHSVSYSRYILDSKMRIVQIDDQFEKITGYSSEDIKNNDIKQIDLLPEDDRTEYLKMVNEQIGQKSLAYFEHRILRKDGQIIFVFCYGKVYYDSAENEERSEIIIFESANTYAMQIMIGEEKNKAEARLAKWEDKYRCDSLTGLLNHEAIKNDIEMKLLEGDSKVMFLMMDVDKFKQYNDTYGHRAGDEFLIMLSQSLTTTLRKDDLACRMGGDEFAAALFYDNSIDDSTMLERAQQICDKINLILSSWHGNTSLSMGAVISSEKINTFNRLYETADRALYDAKESGRAKMIVFKG